MGFGMTPPVAIIDADFSWQDEQIAQLKAQDQAARRMARDAASFLKAVLPGHAGSVNDLTDSFIGFICCGTERQIENLERQKSFRASAPKLKSLDEQLIDLVEERNAKQAAIDCALEPMKGLPEEIRPMMELAVNNLLGSDLKLLDMQISSLQRRIEDRAQTPVERETENGQ